MIGCQRVSFAYGQDPVLDEFSHTFQPGITLLRGFSGCGKSTLLKLIAGFLRPDHGVIQLPGNQTPCDRSFQRQDLGFVFQQLNLLPLATIERNLEIVGQLAGVAPTVIEERSAFLLNQLGLTTLAKRRPSTLSGGQQQRAAIARAMIKNPRVLLLDEPTSGLDDLNCRIITQLLESARDPNCICLIATHDNRLDGIAHESLDFNQFLPVEGHLASLVR